ncbi:MAG: hypothetical protein ABIX01_21010 [Chitinophagaceae bacterium]
MVGTIIIPKESSLSISIPKDLIGREVKVIAFAIEDEAEVIETLSSALHADNDQISIPQWQKDLVLAEQKRVQQNPSLLTDWETVRKGLRAIN